jgi:release factor glutamine methyltransferase
VNAREAATETSAALRGAGIEDARLEGEVLVRESAGIDRAAYFNGALLDSGAVAKLAQWSNRRMQREPLPYITGHREFYGREFAVGPGVLVPRPETELLVELGLSELDVSPEAVVVEAGTGSGAVAVSLSAERPGAVIIGTDVSREALAFAQANAIRLAPATRLVRCDLLSAVSGADVVLANLPYIPTWEIEALEPEVSKWEPRVALDGGDDGFALIRRLIDDCETRLRPRLLALEVGFGQAESVGSLLSALGRESWCVKDLAGIDRIVCARW